MRDILSFARRVGKKLTQSHQKLMNEMLPYYGVSCSSGGDGPLLSAICKKKYENYILEIGFGSGIFLAENAKKNPSNCYIGCEPFLTGVVNLLKLIKSENISNIHIWKDDVKLFLKDCEDNFFSTIYILFPDPWHKKKHHKRRLVNSEFSKYLATKLKENGNLCIATDHDDYAQWILYEVTKSESFKIPSSELEDYRQFPEEFVTTKYQAKAAQIGQKSYYFNFIRL